MFLAKHAKLAKGHQEIAFLGALCVLGVKCFFGDCK
jgi:hypothetical protein